VKSGETKEIDKGYKRLMRELKDLKGSAVDVGIFGGKMAGAKSIAQYAIANEFGAEIDHANGARIVIPARSFMRTTVDENRKVYEQAVDVGFTRAAIGGATAKSVLTHLGVIVRRDVKRKIRSIREPANAPSTVERKGSSKPLIDNGDMLRAVDYRTSGT